MSGTRSIAARPQAGTADCGRQPSLSLALLVIATAQLMVVLDSTVVNVTLPPIQRSLQGAGGAIVAPTALSLVTTTFPEGAPRNLVARIGARPVVLAASAISAGGMFWLSLVTEHSSYAGGLLGPTLLTGAGLGLLFTPLTLTSLSKVHDADAGLAFSLINTGQVVGGSIGLAILGTVAWTVVVNTARNAAHAGGSVAHAGGSVAHAADAAHAAGSAQVSISGHALAAGFSRGFEVSAAIMVVALVVAAIMIRVTRRDLARAQP